MAERTNCAIGLHDSVVGSIWRSETTLNVTLEPAYIHQSVGRPGVDDGIGISQKLRMDFENGNIEGDIGELPANIFDGKFQAGSQVYANTIALPYDTSERVSLTLHLSPDNRSFCVSGHGI